MPSQSQNEPSFGEKFNRGVRGIFNAGVLSLSGIAANINQISQPAQHQSKIPTSANMPPRGAAPSATSAASYYSTRAKASIGVQNLENSYRLPAQAARGEGATGLLGAAQRGGKAVVGAGRWLIGGISATTVALTAVTTSAILGISEGLLTRPTVSGADEAIAISRARRKKLGLTYPPETVEVQAPTYPFTGGQMDGAYYKVEGTTLTTFSTGYNNYIQVVFYCWGKIESLDLVIAPLSGDPQNNPYQLLINVVCRGMGDEPEPRNTYSYGLGPRSELLSGFTLASDWNITRADGQPDTGGNPPPTSEPVYSVANGINLAPYSPTVGEIESPPPALISQPGDFLYDGARAPLQRVLDGTTPPWARPENPVAKMPGVRNVNNGSSAPLTIPQPNVSPSPNRDDKPANPYPFFDPVVFPTTTTPNLFDIQPAFTPSPQSASPIAPNPLTPTGTQFQPNNTTRNPEPSPRTQTQVRREPAPDRNPEQTILQRLPAIATELALLTPIVRGIQTQTSPEAIRDAAQEGTCRSLNGGCSSGVNLNQQVTNAANNSAAANILLQRADLDLLGTIDSKLGPQISNGGISGFIQRAAQFTRIDKIVNALTLLTVLHNAAMLSRSLASTLGDVTSTALATIGIKDENGSPLDINAEISKQANQLMSQLLGAEVWAGTKDNWNKANRIISSANQIIWTVRSIADSAREVTEWIANNTGKIGNALKRFRVVGENAYPHMAENVSHQNAWMLKVQRYREGVDSLDDAASSLQGVLGEVQNIQQEAGELMEQKQRFDAAIQAAQPKTIPDNNPVKDKAQATKTASLSPATQADVFRGTGETEDA